MSASSRKTGTTKSSKRSALNKFERDLVSVVETSVDDVSGEIMGRTIERLLDEGAFDASATSYFGKKGRAGFAIRAVCPPSLAEKIANVLIEETGTLGVRLSQVTRLKVPRLVMSVPFSYSNWSGKVSVKVAETEGKSVRIKPEPSEVLVISKALGLPMREVSDLVIQESKKFLANRKKEN